MPLGLTLDKFGNQRPDDAKRFEVTAETTGLDARDAVLESFAMAQFRDMKDSEKLSASDFELEDAGLKLAAAGNQTATSLVTKRIARYEQIIIDNNFKRAVVRFKVLIAGLFSHFLANNAAARCEVSARTRDQKHLFDDKIEAKQNVYAMVNLDSNGPIDGMPVFFASRAKAKEFIANQNKRTPGFAKQAHIVRPHEMQKAA